MRQAGRYMPEYRALRAKHSFLQMCHEPDLIAEVTLLPIHRFKMDAAILFSDILMIPEALGLGLRFDDGVGPIIERPVRDSNDVKKLPMINATEQLKFVSQGIKNLLPQLKVPLIGFCGAPFTVASYMIEGASSKNLKLTKKWMLQEPNGFHSLLDHIANCSIDYLNMQIDAGVHALQIFDSWTNFLAHSQFREFSLEYIKRILGGLKKKEIPVIVFCKGSSAFAHQISELVPAGISIDWNSDISQIRKSVSSKIALQGNLDPDILYAPIPVIQKEVKKILDSMKNDPGFIFNLGHGIFPDISCDAVQVLVETVHSS
jgi:uroporphyrinogen decarboxylase